MLPGFEDIKAREVIGFDGQGRILVKMGKNHDGTTKVVPFTMHVNANGALAARPVEIDNTPDQVGGQPVGERVPVEQRWATTDQG